MIKYILANMLTTPLKILVFILSLIGVVIIRSINKAKVIHTRLEKAEKLKRKNNGK